MNQDEITKIAQRAAGGDKTARGQLSQMGVVDVDKYVSTFTPSSPTTIEQAYSNIDTTRFTPTDSSDERELQRIERDLRKTSQSSVNDNEIFQRNLQRFQKEIDAVNQIYADKLRGQQQVTKGNLGTTTAISARAGALGSPIGEAQFKNVQDESLQAENMVRQEQSAKIQAILGKARDSAASELAEKRAAKEAGTREYLAFLGDKQVRKQTKLSNLAKKLIAEGVDIANVDPTQIDSIAKAYGLSSAELKTAYTEAKTAQETAEAEARQGRLKSVSEGQTLIDPVTGEVVFSAPKTFAPKAGTAGGSGVSAGTNELAKDWALAIVEGRAKITDIPASQASLRSAVAQELANPQMTQARKADLDATLNVIDTLLEDDAYKSITGVGQFFPSITNALAYNTYEQLKGILALENRQKLKGSGAISDFEARTLERAASSLGRNLSNEDFKKVLDDVRQTFESARNRASTQVPQTQEDPMGLFQ